MIPTKAQMIEVFHDTLKFFDEDSILARAVYDAGSKTKVYSEDFAEEVASHKTGRVDVVPGRTLQTALKLNAEYPGKRIAVLNFAASQHPGGGVWHGSRAQEESICRSSTLYPSLISEEADEYFYRYHESNCGWVASNRCIYSRDVVICRDDSDYIPARLSPKDFVKADVITCAAPHIFANIRISPDALYDMHLSRARNILRVCAYNGADILVTGAFGCGAFKNPSEIVAAAWHEALNVYREKFDAVIFAIYFSGHESENYRVFREELLR